ncbi:enoyl-CoA hydratase/isomerase family protein [Rhodococcus sp. WS4]|nr:enoyl-CoA hydratase/isomerase family protein [Rhodococcus sp. WS4]
MSSVLREQPSPGVHVVTLNRPDRLNALNYALLDALFETLDDIDADIDARAVILTGAGRGFCAGLDLDDDPVADQYRGLGPVQGAAASHRQWWQKLAPRIRGLRVPVIAAVNGPAAGAGLVIALAADIRIANSQASFHDAFIKVGLSGCELGLSWLLPRVVGMSHAADIMLTGRPIDALHAEKIGLVLDAVPDENLLATALAKADQIAANSPHGVWMTKEAMWAGLESTGLQATIAFETLTQINTSLTADSAEQRRARTEKRTPSYRNA